MSPVSIRMSISCVAAVDKCWWAVYPMNHEDDVHENRIKTATFRDK